MRVLLSLLLCLPGAVFAQSSASGLLVSSSLLADIEAAVHAAGGDSDVAEVIAATLTEDQILLASDAQAEADFGSALAVSGNRVLVGAPFTDCSGGYIDCGAAYVFGLEGGVWAEQAKLVASDGTVSDWFGSTVALSGDRALVGAAQKECAIAASGCGSAYVFEFDGSEWTQTDRLQAEDLERNASFGGYVSLSGDRALIGAPRADCAAGEDCGAAYVFSLQGGVWTQQGKLTASDAAVEDVFGGRVWLSGDRALISAAGADCSDGEDCGAVYEFAYTRGTWVQQAKHTAPDADARDRFGRSLSVSGDRVLVGAFPRKAYVFAVEGTSWTQQAILAPAGVEHAFEFGNAVALSGDLALVSARQADCSAGPRCGAAYLFWFDGRTWTQQGKLLASDGTSEDWLGYSVAFVEGQAFVGAPFRDCAAGEECGAVYVFDGLTPTLSLDVTVGRAATAVCVDPTDPGSCDVSATSVTASPGEDLVVLYTVENLGTVPLTSHDLTDSEAGVLLNNFPLVLAPGDVVKLGDLRTAPDTPDVYTYDALWTARDDGGSVAQAAAAYEVRVELGLNQPPIADAGDDQTVVVGQTVTLDGSGSSDRDGDALTFAWTLSGPASPTLSGAATASPMFCAAETGVHTATLTVNDGTEDSAPDDVLITAVSVEEALEDLSTTVEDLGPEGDGTLTGGLVTALTRKLEQAQLKRDRGQDPTPHLEAFRNQVESLVAEGRLTPEQAATLLGKVDDIAEADASPCSGAGSAGARVASATAATVELAAPYPNPVSGQARVPFRVEQAGAVRLVVYDVRGREVAVLVDRTLASGLHEALFDSSALPEGSYLLRLTVGSHTTTQRVTVIR